MPVAPFVPLIATGISAIGSKFGKPKDAGAGASGAAQGLALQQAANAQSLFNQGQPVLGAATNYFGRLLSGNRAALRSAVSPEANEISDAYKGAENSLVRSNVVGAQRDMAQAELARDRAARISALVPQARRAAAGEMSGIGQNLLQMAQGGTAQAASQLGTLATGNRQQGQYSDQEQFSFGRNLGGLITDVYKAWPRKGGHLGTNAGLPGGVMNAVGGFTF